jgi:hypothetical protein
LKQAIGVGRNVDRGRLISQFDAEKIIRSQQAWRRRKFANQLDLSDLEVDPLILDTVIDFATRQLDRSGKIWILIPHAFEWHPPEGDILGKLEIA